MVNLMDTAVKEYPVSCIQVACIQEVLSQCIAVIAFHSTFIA